MHYPLTVLMLLAATSVHAQDAGLWGALPEQTLSAIVVNDYAAAVAAQAASNVDNPWGDFAQRFGMDPQALAAVATGGLLRGEVFLDGQASQVVIAAVDEQAASELIAGLADGLAKVAPDRLLLAENRAALDAVAKRLHDTSGVPGPVGVAEILQTTEQTSGLKLTWYVAPWLRERLTPETERSPAAGRRLQQAQRNGLTAIKALGGTVQLEGDQPTAADTLVFAPRPWESTLRMLDHLQGCDDLTLAPWIPAQVSDVRLFRLDAEAALAHVAVLFDEAFAQGIEGTYEGTLVDLQRELNVDLPQDLYPVLGPRVFLVTTPATEDTPAGLLCAFETSDSPQAAHVAELLMRDDPEVKPTKVGNHPHPMWYVPRASEGGEDFIFMVAQGYLYYANNVQLLQEVLGAQPGNKACPRLERGAANHSELPLRELGPADRLDLSQQQKSLPSAVEGDALASDKTVEATRQAIIDASGVQPSLLFVRGAAAATTEGADQPLRLVFGGFDSEKQTGGASPDAEAGLFSAALPRWSGFRVMVGWLEPNGLRLISRKGSEK